MTAVDHSAKVARFIRLLDAPNEPEAQAAFRMLRAYCQEHKFELTALRFGQAAARIELVVASSDDSTRRTIRIVEDQQNKTQEYCAYLERQVAALSARLAELEARPRRRRKKAGKQGD